MRRTNVEKEIPDLYTRFFRENIFTVVMAVAALTYKILSCSIKRFKYYRGKAKQSKCNYQRIIKTNAIFISVRQTLMIELEQYLILIRNCNKFPIY